MKIQISIKHILWLLGFAIGYYLYSNIKIIDTMNKDSEGNKSEQLIEVGRL